MASLGEFPLTISVGIPLISNFDKNLGVKTTAATANTNLTMMGPKVSLLVGQDVCNVHHHKDHGLRFATAKVQSGRRTDKRPGIKRKTSSIKRTRQARRRKGREEREGCHYCLRKGVSKQTLREGEAPVPRVWCEHSHWSRVWIGSRLECAPEPTPRHVRPSLCPRRQMSRDSVSTLPVRELCPVYERRRPRVWKRVARSGPINPRE